MAEDSYNYGKDVGAIIMRLDSLERAQSLMNSILHGTQQSAGIVKSLDAHTSRLKEITTKLEALEKRIDELETEDGERNNEPSERGDTGSGKPSGNTAKPPAAGERRN